ncbi:MAG TPA: potassium channel family protein [Solirubrobacterales bacterium]|nr:potassium channel family protein [Solirubrobacterales bacterium]
MSSAQPAENAEKAPQPVHYGPGMDARSTRVAERLNTPMLIAAALTLPSVAISESRPGGALHAIAIILNWTIWIAFLVELVVMLAVVPDRRAWLKANPLDLIIVVFTPPVLPAGLQSLRVLRLLRLVRLLRLAQLSREVFSLEGLRYAMLLALLTIFGGAALFQAFERSSQHLNFGDSLYWALTTMTTLGSNYYPTTTGGQIVSTFTLLVGIGFVALLTGAFAQRFLAPEIVSLEEELAAEEMSAEEMALRELRSVQEQLQALEVAVEKMARRDSRSSASR